MYPSPSPNIQALAECSRIDECQDWADKAGALASYAKQAKDDELRKMAMRIQARAIRRCGELLRLLDARGNHRRTVGTLGSSKSQYAAAKEAGLSEHQQLQAVRVASVSVEQFEAFVESSHPPTITKLAESGKKTRPLVDLAGIDPKEYALSTDGQDQLRRLAFFISQA